MAHVKRTTTCNHKNGFVTPATIFNLELNCTSRKDTTCETLQVNHFPSSVLELKEAIQFQFSIPVCVQQIAYQFAILADGDSLKERNIRSGDTFSVSYLCEGECKYIMEIVEWIQDILKHVKIEQESNEPDIGSKTDKVIAGGMQAGHDGALTLELFDWLDAKSYVNKLFFEMVGGLTVVRSLWKKMQALQWKEMPLTFKFLESFTAHIYANFGETVALRRVLLKCGALEMCIKSFLRIKLSRDQPIEDKISVIGNSHTNSYLFRRVLENTLHVICNFSELPECQVSIASAPDVLQQMLCMSLSEFYLTTISVLVAEVFLCLGHCPATHQYLTQPEIIDGLLAAYIMRSETMPKDENERLVLVSLKCFTLVVLAQLILVSPHLIPDQFSKAILDLITDFLSEARPDDIKQYEENQVCVWATLLPYVKLLYLPNQMQTVPCTRLDKLQNTSKEIILFFLHSKVTRDIHCKILVKEGLVDFITILPWYTSCESSSRSKVEALAFELNKHVPLQPPKLSSIAKGTLARMYFGLERVVNSHSPMELICDFYPS